MSADVPEYSQPRSSKPAGFLAPLRRAIWPVGDQALLAIASFVTLILLARQLSVEDFGAFTLVYALLYFVNSIQSSLITQPHNVLGATRRGADYTTYTMSTAVSQIGLAIASALLALAGWGLASKLESGVAPVLLAAALATVAWQCQEFLRRVLYTELRVAAAFVIDSIAYGGQIIGAVLLWQQDMLSGPLMMYVTAGTRTAAAIVGCWLVRDSLRGAVKRAVIIENWHFGKWVAGGTIIAEWLSAQMLVVLAAAALGTAAAGVLRAIHTMFGPTRILAQVFSITLPTRLTRTLAEQGTEAFRTNVRKTLLLAAPVLGGYCALVALFATPLLTLVFGEKYREYGVVLRLYAVSAFLTYLCMIGTAVLRARKHTRPIFVAEVIYLLVIPLGALLIPVWQLAGVVVGLIAGDIACLAFIGWACWRAAAWPEAVEQLVEPECATASSVEGALP